MTTAPAHLQILGIDAAVDPRNTGYAIATSHAGKWRIDALATGTRTTDLADRITAQLDPERPILLAIDAPLGWPEPMATALETHRAGEALSLDPTTDFARETDRFVREEAGLRPLDVGADRIARTAAAALALIARLRQESGQPTAPGAVKRCSGRPDRGLPRRDPEAARPAVSAIQKTRSDSAAPTNRRSPRAGNEPGRGPESLHRIGPLPGRSHLPAHGHRFPRRPLPRPVPAGPAARGLDLVSPDEPELSRIKPPNRAFH